MEVNKKLTKQLFHNDTKNGQMFLNTLQQPKTRLTSNDSSNNTSNDASDIWVKLSKQYDVESCSFDELCQISTILYEHGEISLYDHELLTFDPGICLQSTYSTANVEDEYRDWIAEYHSRAKDNLKTGNLLGYKNALRILQILKNLL